jgi:hypothetical protein
MDSGNGKPSETAARAAAGSGSVPPDIATMRATARHVLLGGGLFSDLAEAQVLVSTLRGHLHVMLPEVEQLAAHQDDHDLALLVPVNTAIVACTEVRRMLDVEPRLDLYSTRRVAERFARRLNALIDHYENLSAAPGL